jgi:putative membrane protein
MQTRLAYVLLFGCMVFAALAGANAAVTSSMRDFVSKVATSNQFEITSSQLALKESKSDDVKRFAQQMIDDHKRLGDAFNAALASPAVSMPSPATMPDAAQQAQLDTLDKAPHAKFDRVYLEQQVQAHTEAVGLFKEYAHNGNNAVLRDFAGQSLPVIRHHLDEADQLRIAH